MDLNKCIQNKLGMTKVKLETKRLVSEQIRSIVDELECTCSVATW